MPYISEQSELLDNTTLNEEKDEISIHSLRIDRTDVDKSDLNYSLKSNEKQ